MSQTRFPAGSVPRSKRLPPAAAGVVLAAAATVILGTLLQAGSPGRERSSQQPAPAAPAARTDAALPSARVILDRHVEAIGGREGILRHSSSRVTGTFSMPAAGITGTLELYAAAPNKSFVKITLPGVGDALEGFDGTRAWAISPMTGPMLLEGVQLEQKRFDSEFHAELRPDDRYASISTVERTEFDGRPCYKVRLVRKMGGEDFEFYDVATGLKAGSILTRETPMGAVTLTSVETDYKKFGDLLQATTLRRQFGPVEQVLQIATVEYDSVDPSVFELPAEIKALIK